MLDVDVFADELFGFIAQQSLEKSLKAWLSALGRPYPYTHDLTDLVLRLRDAGQDASDLDDLAEFNPFAVQLRYSVYGSDEEEPLDRAAIINVVGLVLTRARQVVFGGKMTDNNV
jgi:HEPN domain-containing protein